MNKKKLVYDIALVLVPVLLLVFLIINHGFESFKLLEGLVDAFQYGFFLGLTYICLPLSIIADMVLLCARYICF